MMADHQKAWELENAVELIDARRDALFDYDEPAQKAYNNGKIWTKNSHHFKRVKISAVALLKMVMHARSGGSIEVMGLMQGLVTGDTFIVTDAFRLPVEGTETRVNAADEANEYLIQYLDLCRANGRAENAIGWYHSHPGYGCWLSGIDVATQELQQTYQDPFLAIVIDPDRTISAGRVEIGAFRTVPKNDDETLDHDEDGYQSIPLDKVEDFGAHSSRYYPLEVSHFKSSLDTELLQRLWNKYWVSTLTQSTSSVNREFGSRQMTDLGKKLCGAERSIHASSRGGFFTAGKDIEKDFSKFIQEGNKIANEERLSLAANDVKETLFNNVQTFTED